MKRKTVAAIKLQTMKLLLVILLSVALVIPQTPQVPVVQPPTPCVDAELKIAAAEKTANDARALAEACLLHAEIAHTENTNAGRDLAAEQKKSASLAVSYDGARRQIAELQKTNTGLTAERDRLKGKIQKANGTVMCEIFHLGCVGEQ